MKSLPTGDKDNGRSSRCYLVVVNIGGVVLYKVHSRLSCETHRTAGWDFEHGNSKAKKPTRQLKHFAKILVLTGRLYNTCCRGFEKRLWFYLEGAPPPSPWRGRRWRTAGWTCRQEKSQESQPEWRKYLLSSLELQHRDSRSFHWPNWCQREIKEESVFSISH